MPEKRTETEGKYGVGRSQADVLAERLLEALADFHSGLDGRGFPIDKFDKVWQLFEQYYEEMEGADRIHRRVASEFAGLREYMQLGFLKTPGQFLAMADRMERMLFEDRDAYPEGVEPIGEKGRLPNDEHDFGHYHGFCIGCDRPGRVDATGLCQECANKLERDLIRSRDWASSATAAYGLTEAQCENLRRQVIRKHGDRMELIAEPTTHRPGRKQRKKARKRRTAG